MKTLTVVDLVQAEWVATAYIAGETRMIDVVEQKIDPHLRTGALISGAPEEFVKVENDLVGHLTDPSDIVVARQKLPHHWGNIAISDFFLPRTMSIRQAGKKGNHGLNYREEYKTFALVNGLDESEAKGIVEAYRGIAYPGLKRWYKQLEDELRNNNRRITNCFGQTRQFLDRWGPDLLNAATAFKPQSTVANVTNFGLKRIYHDTVGEMKRTEPRAQEHDSLLLHHTFSSWEELSCQILRCDAHMTQTCVYQDREFVLEREWKIGLDWGEDSMLGLDIAPNTLTQRLEETWDRLHVQEA